MANNDTELWNPSYTLKLVRKCAWSGRVPGLWEVRALFKGRLATTVMNSWVRSGSGLGSADVDAVEIDSKISFKVCFLPLPKRLVSLFCHLLQQRPFVIITPHTGFSQPTSTCHVFWLCCSGWCWLWRGLATVNVGSAELLSLSYAFINFRI